MTCTTVPWLDKVKKSRFLDRHGQFAKRLEFIHTIRLIYEDGSHKDLNYAEWRQLPNGVREILSNMESI